jgi:hypothetical protein
LTPLFKKLHLKAHMNIVVLGAPTSFDQEYFDVEAYTSISRVIDANKKMVFVLSFVKSRAEIDSIVSMVFPNITDDTIWWFA